MTDFLSAVKQWGFNLCLAITIGGIVQTLAPSENMRRTLKITISVFLIACLLSPLRLFSELEVTDSYSLFGGDSSDESGESAKKLDEQLLRASETTISGIIRGKLEEFEVYAEDISVTSSFDENGAIYAQGIIITVAPEYIDNKYAIGERIYQQLGLRCEIVSTD